ncbi:helix-turn-helix transcriptional regulator [Photobacterium aphoticum]|uniref:Transcriptional regulator n=1 Tax=Photobacterium aphoticum TaxID=754436 RepID=A0A090QSC2_9GAMM|nr:metalloregulator ArsR/SmtB family transcription factor [Photobacterium aphoticum]KLU99652.1 transcriptional regulator [Photobacterium aphoticum]PSU53884.1 transcriptional regulator [Photobacterium aphoticum]GAL05806.1 predicted transcriptional regulator [Photobacterium aphoticum]GHA44073.1 transcriptional regulator [Photobacterium aphoticum]
MKTIDRILYQLKREGPQTAKRLAETFQLTSMGVRQHLQGLEADGLVSFEDVKVKVGRPTRHWFLTKAGHNQFANRHDDLLVQTLDSVETLFGKDGLQQVIARREANTLAHYQDKLAEAANLEEKLQILTTLREQEGYMANYQPHGDGFLFVENHCPICHAAHRCPSLCQSELTVFQQLLGEEYHIERKEHIIAGERRCAYRIIKA